MRSYLIYNHNDMEGAFHDMANIMKNLGMTSITARFYLSDGYATELADNGACKLSEPIYEKKITNKSEGTLHCFYMMVASVEEKSYKDIHFDKSTIACKTILLNYKNQWFGFKNRYNDKTLSLSLFNDVTDYRILDDNAYGTPPKKFSVLTNKVIDNWINYLNQLKDIAVSLRNKGNKEWMEYRSKIIALARKYNLKEVDANYSENSYNINDKTCSGSLNHNGVTLTFEYDKNNCRAYEKLSFLIYKNGLTKMDLWEKYCNNGFDF